MLAIRKIKFMKDYCNMVDGVSVALISVSNVTTVTKLTADAVVWTERGRWDNNIYRGGGEEGELLS